MDLWLRLEDSSDGGLGGLPVAWDYDFGGGSLSTYPLSVRDLRSLWITVVSTYSMAGFRAAYFRSNNAAPAHLVGLEQSLCSQERCRRGGVGGGKNWSGGLWFSMFWVTTKKPHAHTHKHGEQSIIAWHKDCLGGVPMPQGRNSHQISLCSWTGKKSYNDGTKISTFESLLYHG